MLLAWAIGKDRTWVLTHPEYALTESEQKKYSDALKRKENHEPVAYITGEKEFYGLPFYVTRDVLIPRPETELLVDKAIEYLTTSPLPSPYKGERDIQPIDTIIDIGTGSGNIILSVALKSSPLSFRPPSGGLQTGQALPSPCKGEGDAAPLLLNKEEVGWRYTFIATDISPAALAIAQKNHERLCPDIPIQFIESDLLNFLVHKTSPPALPAGMQPSPKEGMTNILILANLPYLPTSDKRQITKNILNYEPHTALFSGKDGINHYRRLIKQIETIKKPGQTITLIIESNPNQHQKLKQLADSSFNVTTPFISITVFK